MRKDVSGWQTRLSDEMVARFTAGGQWSGVTLVSAARKQALGDNGVAVVDGATQHRFSDIYDKAQRLAAQFRRRGLQPGDVVSFQLPNWHEAMVINLAAAIGGFICNPIVAIYRDAEVGFILKDARARVLFIPERHRNFDHAAMAERLREQLPELTDVVLVRAGRTGDSSYEAWTATAADGAFPDVDANAIKLLLYTSGTTGKPKGVLHSHNTIRAEIDAVTKFWSLTARDAVFMPSPVTHITGYLYALELPFAIGIRAVMMDRWDAAQAIQLITSHGLSFSIGATPLLVELVAAVDRAGISLPSLRFYASGGAPVPPEVIARARAALPNCTSFRVYGSSEAPTVSLGIAPGDPVERGAATDGRIFNHEVRIVDDVTGADCGIDQEGEILARGPEVMLGYTDPVQSVEAFDPHGFFRTGDLGSVDAEGYLTVSGRKKDLIIRGGENISPKEVEDVLHRHPAIREVAVVAMPHPRMGETPCAYAILRPGAELDLAGMIGFLESNGLARQKYPERLVLVDDLPRTASGKVLKHELRKAAAMTTG
jgi:acyl-CoA synthetase (AMP-forming)/AMP-acid ligase II